MKFSSTLFVSLPLLVCQVLAVAVPNKPNGGNAVSTTAKAAPTHKANGGSAVSTTAKAAATHKANGGQTNNKASGGHAANNKASGGNAANNTGNAANNTSNAANNTSNAANNTASDAANNNAGGGNAQTSLTLDPAVVAKGFANNGQDVPEAGQVASLTSTNNFINFCLTVNAPLTNGQQIKTGSCNPAPMGAIPSTANMPSAKFVNPTNLQNIAENTAFTVQMAISKLTTGNFVNADENYFSAPQQLDGNGQIKGHSHVVIEQVSDLRQATPTNPNVFAFFKGLNAAASGGILTANVTSGLPAGTYRLASINTSANHAPVLVPIAQHGTLDDVVYFTVGAAAQAAAAKLVG
jgi:hypothetical protein